MPIAAIKPAASPFGATVGASPALQALKLKSAVTAPTAAATGSAVNANGSVTPGAAAPVGSYSYTPVNTARTDASFASANNAQQQSVDAVKANEDWAKQSGLNALNASQRGAASDAARQGLAAGGASYLSGASQGLINGTNALNQNLSNWNTQYSGALGQQAGTFQAQAGVNAGIAGTNATGANNAVNHNADLQSTNLQADNTNKTAARDGVVSSATTGYNNLTKNGATPGSALSQDWIAANNTYGTDKANGASPAQLDADIKALSDLGAGTNYTKDGHNRNDPKLIETAVKNGARAQKQPDGSINYVLNGKIVGTRDAQGNTHYSG